MTEVEMTLNTHPGEFVLLPHGLFRLTNPQAVVRGRVHVFRYFPTDQFATIVAIGITTPQVRRES